MTLQPDDRVVAEWYGVTVRGTVIGIDGETISVLLDSDQTVRVQRKQISAIIRGRA